MRRLEHLIVAALLAAVAADPAQPAAVREAARAGLAEGGVIPAEVEEIRAIRAERE